MVLTLVADDDWMDRANCLGIDGDLFHPERGASSAGAKQVCAGCSVRERCLEHALAHDERFGIWGGLSARERARLAAHRRRGAS